MTKVDYNNISKDFAKSRKNMKWEEIEYFLEKYASFLSWKRILDVWCWSWRLLENFFSHWIENIDYTWIDASSWMIEEAKKNFPNEKFLVSDMLDLEKFLSWGKYDFIFFIASFHHLDSLEKRQMVLSWVKSLLNEKGIVFMTNWDLRSEINYEKYKLDIISNSQNEFGSFDYNIKFWEYWRYYHSFSLKELYYLFEQNYFKIIENRLFNTWKNIISIFQN